MKPLIPEEKAAITAQNLVANTKAENDKRTLELMGEFFDMGADRKRFLDAARIPFICADIAEIKANIAWIVKLIIGAVVLGAIGLMFK